MRHQLYREQQLNCNVEEAWKFFSSPNNLSKITPKDMAFTVLSKDSDQPIFVGMKIDYTVSPLFNIPLKWTTKIIQVEENKSFTDFQEKGPYKYWHHFHEFIPNENGVLMKDTVDYELPLGFLGSIAHQVIVKDKLKKIFDYRFQVLDQFFNQ
ncbi:Ligand-binding SRPBCC domain-containing protein [Chishuiella changwenlii]|uniref:Ligand-binding SRPBCC domain-containing protein n=1 Tax=Chishuiella changwenlii TaxID=1434701 RepID=A0A1M7CUL4_9FLAO|nr:SRPBCC family protein [Chishuiella changwenlii]GGF10778.1 hypothetical protein GCM10010984_29860 [Chishuiella changwenlii]SHL70926.1 Ligand-binding SRPBCC domain-containing protein [Chishuiella changwenlii]